MQNISYSDIFYSISFILLTVELAAKELTGCHCVFLSELLLWDSDSLTLPVIYANPCLESLLTSLASFESFHLIFL